ncbi:MAG TPA: AtpZ/AtpI family protein [Gemmatimonadales bacterium]|nr:AtpZ/AtpI family protein [Gemmatimonadales bacterium]
MPLRKMGPGHHEPEGQNLPASSVMSILPALSNRLRKISQAGIFAAVKVAPSGGNGPSPMRFAGLGIQLAVTMLLGLFLGQWADRKFGTGSLLTILGAFLGFGLTFWSLLRQVGRDGQGGRDGKGEQGGQDGQGGK